MSRSIQATETYHIRKGTRVDVYLFGRSPEKLDWNTTPLKTKAGLKTPAGSDLFMRFQEVSSVFEIEKILAPSAASSNAKIITHHQLSERIRSTKYLHSPELWRGALADGAIIPLETGFFIASADCPTIIVISLSGLAIAAHAGRDSLFDNAALTRNPKLARLERKHFSVVDAIIERIKPEEIACVFITCGISASYFDHPLEHPRWGAINRARTMYARILGKQCVLGDVKYGRLALKEIIKRQFEICGVNRNVIFSDGNDTFSDLDAPGEYRWWSARRGNQERNGVLVVNRNSR